MTNIFKINSLLSLLFTLISTQASGMENKPTLKTKAEIQLSTAMLLKNRFCKSGDRSDITKAKELLEPLVRQENPEALWLLGSLYVEHPGALGLDLDMTTFVKALKFWRRASNQGLEKAKRFIEVHSQAMDYRQRGGDPEAQYVWAHFHGNLGATEKMRAKRRLGGAYLTGQGVKQDAQKARKFLTLAMECGDPVAAYVMARHFPNEVFEKADRRSSAFFFGRALWLGTHGVTKNVDSAKKYLNEAAALGNVRAVTLLGDIYAAENDPVRAEYFYEAAKRKSISKSAWDAIVGRLAASN